MASYLRTPNSEYAFNTEDDIKVGETITMSPVKGHVKVNSILDATYNYVDKKNKTLFTDKSNEDCAPITIVTILTRE